jgi:chromosome segregation ATPase
MKQEDYEFSKEQLHKYQKEEPLAVERIKTAKKNLEKAKAEFVDAEENLEGIQGGINVFLSEIQRWEKDHPC